METELIRTGGNLEAICSGPCSKADFVQLIDSLAAVREADGLLRACFIDALSVDFALEGMAEFFVGEYAAKRLSGIRIALLAPSGKVTSLLENSAYNRGLKLLVTDSPSAARAWLADL